MRVNDKIIASIIDPDETFIWEVTGSTADIKYNPLVWIANIVMFCLGVVFFKYAQIKYEFSLSIMNLLVFFGIWLSMMFLIDLIGFIILYFYRTYHSYVLTSQRLIIISGIWTKDVDEIELFRIIDSSSSQSMIDLWADLGTIFINSTDKTGFIKMAKIKNPYAVRDSLRKHYMSSRQKKGTVVMESISA